MENTITISVPYKSAAEYEARQKKLIKDSLKDILDEIVNKPTKKQRLLSRKEVADLLHISLPTLHSLTKSGVIKASRINRRVLYDETEVLNALERIQPVTNRTAQ